ncbi:hypothetical protein MAR_027480 [Mya arenaria]|uniref:Uncharacterized protein n=1 Tax=Mya arenaria TaxID=6604 RepID=A0ABY7EVI0_MYAAR|nr:hypothetical protein MAR_027480 [Mya arenaria]
MDNGKGLHPPSDGRVDGRMVEMGSMYMNDNLLTGNLISTGYRKFWTVQTNDPREKKCHGNVQTVRHSPLVVAEEIAAWSI